MKKLITTSLALCMLATAVLAAPAKVSPKKSKPKTKVIKINGNNVNDLAKLLNSPEVKKVLESPETQELIGELIGTAMSGNAKSGKKNKTSIAKPKITIKTCPANGNKKIKCDKEIKIDLTKNGDLSKLLGSPEAQQLIGQLLAGGKKGGNIDLSQLKGLEGLAQNPEIINLLGQLGGKDGKNINLAGLLSDPQVQGLIGNLAGGNFGGQFGEMVAPAPMVKKIQLGVELRGVSPELAAQLDLPKGFGLLVQKVRPGSPAEKAGLKKYDILLKLEDQFVINHAQLTTLLQTMKDGDKTQLTVIRKAKKISVPATVKMMSVPRRPRRCGRGWGRRGYHRGFRRGYGRPRCGMGMCPGMGMNFRRGGRGGFDLGQMLSNPQTQQLIGQLIGGQNGQGIDLGQMLSNPQTPQLIGQLIGGQNGQGVDLGQMLSNPQTQQLIGQLIGGQKGQGIDLEKILESEDLKKILKGKNLGQLLNGKGLKDATIKIGSEEDVNKILDQLKAELGGDDIDTIELGEPIIIDTRKGNLPIGKIIEQVKKQYESGKSKPDCVLKKAPEVKMKNTISISLQLGDKLIGTFNKGNKNFVAISKDGKKLFESEIKYGENGKIEPTKAVPAEYKKLIDTLNKMLGQTKIEINRN